MNSNYLWEDGIESSLDLMGFICEKMYFIARQKYSFSSQLFLEILNEIKYLTRFNFLH